MDIIYMIPVRRDLQLNEAQDYRYSSAIDYAGGTGLVKVEVV
ncbi:MAG: hypothetical protein ACOH2V_14030 [Candidatus Saccharimonadaceae bacterium]